MYKENAQKNKIELIPQNSFLGIFDYIFFYFSAVYYTSKLNKLLGPCFVRFLERDNVHIITLCACT